MKKILLSFVLLLAGAAGMTQNVPRNFVVTEVATGTWCYYCPGAALGVDDLLENGASIAVIENHDGDGYANVYSNARNTMYNVSGVPSTTFDAVQGVVGGDHTNSLYSTFLPIYNQRIAVTSPVSIAMSVSHTGLNYTAVITVTKVGTITATDLRLHLAVTQSHIYQPWQGQWEVNFVNRKMVPDENGTHISFSSGNTVVTTLNFAMNSSWDLKNCELVAFLQNYDAGQGAIPGTSNPPYGSLNKFEIFQGIKLPVTPLTADFIADTTTIDKNGVVNFTNKSFGGFMFVPATYHWSFPGGTPDTSSAENPSVTYTQCGPHDVQLIVHAGGMTDTTVKSNYIYVGPYTHIYPIPNDTVCAPHSITLNANNPAAVSYLWSPGGQTTPMITVDTTGIGIGAHNYSVTIVSSTGCSNSASQTVVFLICTGIASGTEEFSATVFPNPNNGTFMIGISGGKNEIATMRIINSTGATVYSDNNVAIRENHKESISLKDLSPGVYFLAIESSGRKITRKIIIN